MGQSLSPRWPFSPEPKQQWEASTWIYSAIGDTFSSQQGYSGALRAFQGAVTSPDGLGNPFIHLRLGQCRFELGDLEGAADELARAYMGDGLRVFSREDPKYLDFLSTRIRLQ